MKTCIECKNHKIINDPDLNDSFNHDDVAVICTLLSNPRHNPDSRFVADRQNHRCITVACRPYKIKEESSVPKWCPLEVNNEEVEDDVLNIYTYSGPGCALSAEGTVIARSTHEAKFLFSLICNNNGLIFEDEKVKFVEEFRLEPQVIHFWNGDY